MPGLTAAMAELFRAPHTEFVATRKRLAAELAARGNVDAAALIVKLSRPPLSVWVVNQLWWHARATFEGLIASAVRLQDGDSKAGGTYRDAMAKLRGRATALLENAGHAASEQTLRRVTTSLAAIATAGGFEPDLPGALTADREPGHGGHGEVTVTVRARPVSDREATSVDDEDDEHRHSRPTVPQLMRPRQIPPPPPKPVVKPTPRIANGKVHPYVEVHGDDDQATHVVTERSLLEAALATARTTIEASEREREQLQRRLAEVERAIHQARTIVADVEARLVPDDRDDS